MTTLQGRLGGFSDGWDIHAEWDGQHLRGWIGDFTAGQGIALSLNETMLEGRVGQADTGFSLHATRQGETRQGETWHLNLGELPGKSEAILNIATAGVIGQYGESELALQQQLTEVHGYIGNPVNKAKKMAIRMDLGGVPLPVAAVLAVSTFKVWCEQEQLVCG